MASVVKPVVGEVYGFDFIFPPKKHKETHPGLVIGVKPLPDGRFEVIALPISHKSPGKNDHYISISLPERVTIGLDSGHQYVFHSFYGKFTLPGNERMIHGLRKYRIGVASAGFVTLVRERFMRLRKLGY